MVVVVEEEEEDDDEEGEAVRAGDEWTRKIKGQECYIYHVGSVRVGDPSLHFSNTIYYS